MKKYGIQNKDGGFVGDSRGPSLFETMEEAQMVADTMAPHYKNDTFMVVLVPDDEDGEFARGYRVIADDNPIRSTAEIKAYYERMLDAKERLKKSGVEFNGRDSLIGDLCLIGATLGWVLGDKDYTPHEFEDIIRMANELAAAHESKTQDGFSA